MQQTYALAGSQPMMSTVRTINYSGVTTGSVLHKQSAPVDTTIISDSIKTDFGKIKGIEILHFRVAQLERSTGGVSSFASMGPLQVLYFPQYDRFVLSLNSWKYPLLKRIPIVGSSAIHGVPVTYTLPTANGFFSLIITKVEHMESLANLDTILSECATFSVTESDELNNHGNILSSQSNGAHLHQSQYLTAPSTFPMNGNMMQGSISPRQSNYNTVGHLGQSFDNSFQPNALNQSATTGTTGKKKSKWSRIFRKSEYGRDKGDRVGTSRHNLNFVQKRDLNSMKMTTEVMAATTYYPRREVERWIVYNKEMASFMGFSPELADQDLTPFGHSILNRSTENSDPSLPCNQSITADRPFDSITYKVGQNFTSATRHDGKQKHGYIQGHSHCIHPEVAGRYNNLSTSNFEADRFKTMTNTSPLYEAQGMSPIGQNFQPYTFNQIDDNILPVVAEDPKPSITERIKEAVTGSHNAGHTETIHQTEQPHVSFADKVRNMTHHNEQPEVLTQSSRIVESRAPVQTVITENLQPTTQILSGSHISTGMPTTQYIAGSNVTAPLPTLQERIRTAGTTLQQPTIGQRIQNTVTGAEHSGDLVQHHYAA